MTKQGVAIGTADDMWKFLAKGDFTVSADVKAQAQADIADDGYWGVEQTSDRILDFAKALSGDNPDKADAMLEAFKKGFEQATKAWGDKLPDISQRTYDAVVEKFNKWKNGTEDASTEAYFIKKTCVYLCHANIMTLYTQVFFFCFSAVKNLLLFS